MCVCVCVCVCVCNVLNCDIVVSELEFQSRFYSHFRTNALLGEEWIFLSSQLEVE